MEDFLHRLCGWYINAVGNVPEGKVVATVRLALLFAAPMAIYYSAFISGNRGGLGRMLAAIVADGLILSMAIPLPCNVTARAWILTGCLLMLAYIPGAYPFLIYREAGRQRRLRTALYVVMAVLLFVGLLWS
jgi:hypothetical protein